MMSVKMATLGIFKRNIFWNKEYDVIIFVNDVSNKNLLRESNYTVDVVIWPKFGNCSISMREIMITSILLGFHQINNLLLSGGLGSSSIILDGD